MDLSLLPTINRRQRIIKWLNSFPPQEKPLKSLHKECIHQKLKELKIQKEPNEERKRDSMVNAVGARPPSSVP